MKTRNKDFTEGPIFSRMILFVIPLVLTGILQYSYGIADSIVVGRFSGDNHALAAVTSSASMSSLFISVFIALSAGAGIMVAQSYGARDYEKVSKTTHTAIALSALGGIIIMIITVIAARPALILLGTKPELLDKATLYMVIIALGIPATSIYNFASSILRATGDSKTSLSILSVSGLVNLLLNLLFVIVFKMAVSGVALATVLTHYLSTARILLVLFRNKGECYAISLRKMKIDKSILREMLGYGIPLAIQTLLLSLSDLFTLGATNSFPTTVISAKAITANMDGIIGTAMRVFATAAMTFVGQNFGAKKPDRMKKSLFCSLISVVVLGILLAQILRIFEIPIANLYIDASNPDKENVLAAVSEINVILLNFYFLLGAVNVLTGAIKALGESVLSMSASLAGGGVNVFLLLVILPIPRFHTVKFLYLATVFSRLFMILLLVIFLIYVWRKKGISELAREEKIDQEI